MFASLGGQARRLGETVRRSLFARRELRGLLHAEGDIWLVRSDGTGAHKLASVGEACAMGHRLVAGRQRHPVYQGRQRFGRYRRADRGFTKLIPGWHASAWNAAAGGLRTEILSVPVQPSGLREEGRDLGSRRAARAVSPAASRADSTDSRPHRVGAFRFQARDGKRIFARADPTRRASRYRPEDQTVPALPRGHFRPGRRLLQRRQVDSLCLLPEGILWKANRDGSNPVQLSEPPIRLFFPAGRPTARRFAFTGWTPTTQGRIYIVSSDGGSPPKFLAED